MKKMICCIAMFLFSLLAACAYADVTAGNIIPFGSWHQESAALDSSPVLWRVLEVRDDRALLLSDKAYRQHLEKNIHRYWCDYGTPQASLRLMGITR